MARNRRTPGGCRLQSASRLDYLDNGYYLAPGMVEHPAIDAFVADLQAIAVAQLKRRGLPQDNGAGLDALDRNLIALHRQDQAVYVATLRVFGRLKSLYDLFAAPQVAQACSTLGVRLPMHHTLPLFHLMSKRLRIDGGYHGFEAHQDWTGLQTSLNAVVVWLPCHDVNARLFPLEVIPHSHAKGLCRGVVEGNDYRIDESCFRDREFLPLDVKKGDAVFMSPFTIHRTGLTDTDELRIAVSWRYEDALEATFVERGYPLAQSRVVRHELFVPGFPDPEQLRKALNRGRRD